jgi:hypothetical protein
VHEPRSAPLRRHSSTFRLMWGAFFFRPEVFSESLRHHRKNYARGGILRAPVGEIEPEALPEEPFFGAGASILRAGAGPNPETLASPAARLRW